MVETIIHYDGDILESVEIKRGKEVRPLWQKLEHLTPEQMILWIDRFDSLCPIASEWALAQALELSAELTVPKRTQFVRSILCEVNRLVWLTTYLGRIMEALGQRSLMQQIFILREQVFICQEELTGGRILPQAFTIGGCRRNLAVGDVQKVRQFVQGWKFSWDKWLELIVDPLLVSRLEGLLKVPQIIIEKLAWWGVVGKGSGVSYDSRKHRPHGAYPFIDFELPTSTEKYSGDAYSRFRVAIDEIKLSLNIIDQLLKTISGDIPTTPTYKNLKAGIFYGFAESAKGPVIAAVEVNNDETVTSLRLFSTGQRVWPVVEPLFKGIRAEDFELAFASLGLDGEDAET